MTFEKIAFAAGDAPKAEKALARLTKRYDHVAPEEADVIVALGGDGFMLETLHRYLSRKAPIYGMNCGTIGFLMNEYGEDDLPARLAAAERTDVHPLRMQARDEHGETTEALAINEVSLLRQRRQAAKIRISVDGKVRTEELICDGVLVSTAAGSSAYNLSAHGPIIPLGAEVLALTPICAFRPRRWRGALLPAQAKIRFEILDHVKRAVSAVADYTEVRDVVDVSVEEARDVTLGLLFDPGHSLEERILSEQFTP